MESGPGDAGAGPAARLIVSCVAALQLVQYANGGSFNSPEAAMAYTDEFFRKMYEDEWARKDKHDAADSALLPIVTLLGGVSVYFFKIQPESVDGWWNAIFVGLCCGYWLLFVAAVMFLVCSISPLFPRWVAYVGDPKEFRNYVEGLFAHFEPVNSNREQVQAAVDAELQRTARAQYAICTSSLRQANVDKTVWQARCKSCLAICVSFLLLNAYPAYLVQKSRPDVQKVIILKDGAFAQSEKSKGFDDDRTTKNRTQAASTGDFTGKAAPAADAGAPADPKVPRNPVPPKAEVTK